MWSRFGFGTLRRRLIAAGVVLLLGSASGTAQDAGRAAPQLFGGDRVPDVIVAPASGIAPVSVYSGADGTRLASGWPFGQGFAGGVRVAAGDLTGDGVPDVVVAMGPGGGLVRIFSGVDASEIESGHPFGSGFTGGIHVAVADVDRDGRADVIAGQGEGGGEVRIYSGADRRLLASGTPFGMSDTGGVHVAAGDVTGDGYADIIVGRELGGAVRVFSGRDYSIVASHFPYGATYAAGVHVAAGDVNGDGRQDVIVGPGAGDAPVRVYDPVARVQLASIAAYGPGFAGGARVAAADFTGDGAAEIITIPGPSAPPLLRVFDGATLSIRASLLVYESSFAGGMFVAAPIPDPLRITSGDEALLLVGRPGSVTITTSGSSPRTALAVTGTLPSGITFTDEGGGTATLAGISGPGTAGTYALTVTAATGVGAPVTQAFRLRVGLAPNTAPTFVGGADQSVLQNSAPHTVPAWATAISAGPLSDEGQTASFIIAGNTNPALFSAAPSVSPTGTLTYALAPDAFGTATLTVVLRDDGGTGGGGMDTSPPDIFTIAVAPLQCAPGTYTHDGSSTNGAGYTIKIPDNWNGTLIVYARHYELTRPTQADAFWPGLPEPLFGSTTGQEDFETPLLAAGYALAGSTLRDGGWVVAEGGQDLANLKTVFRTNHCVPADTIVVGFDMGGLIALKSMEAPEPIFDGAIAACTPAAGMTKNVDRALVQNMAIEATLAWPLSWGSPGDVRDDVTLAEIQAVHYLGFQDVSPRLFPAFDFVRRLLGERASEYYFNPPTLGGRTLVWYFTLLLADLERRLGGPVAQSAGQSPYTMSAQDLASVNASIQFLELLNIPCNPADGPVCPLPAGITAEQFLADLNAMPPVMADPTARARLAAANDLTGLVNGPVMTLHSTIDQLFPASGTTAYLDAVTASGRQQHVLRQFTDSLPGHCGFTPAQIVSAIAAMRSWLATGVRPAASDQTLFPFRLGFEPFFDPGPWPF